MLAEQMARTLSRHGIHCETVAITRGGVSVGDALLNHAADSGCDLLVMGCYGHSVLREALFGGATQDLLDHMTVPVLMSH